MDQLINRDTVSRDKVFVANIVLVRQVEVFDAMNNARLPDFGYPAFEVNHLPRVVAAECWIWDEAEQHIAMCTGIPLTRAYVKAQMMGESTQGIAQRSPLLRRGDGYV